MMVVCHRQSSIQAASINASTPSRRHAVDANAFETSFLDHPESPWCNEQHCNEAAQQTPWRR